MSELLSLPAWRVAIRDAVAEGTYVTAVTFRPPEGGDDEGTEAAHTRRFKWDETVRVIHPAPMEPCGCGFAG